MGNPGRKEKPETLLAVADVMRGHTPWKAAQANGLSVNTVTRALSRKGYLSILECTTCGNKTNKINLIV